MDISRWDSYDPLGRPLIKRQLFSRNGVVSSYSINQTYDLAGNVKTVAYPSGRTVNYSYDRASRLSSFIGNMGGSPSTYADTISYNAAGQITRSGSARTRRSTITCITITAATCLHPAR